MEVDHTKFETAGLMTIMIDMNGDDMLLMMIMITMVILMHVMLLMVLGMRKLPRKTTNSRFTMWQ